MFPDPNCNALPGEDLVERGIRDVREGRRSAEALLVAIGAPRLRRLGFDLPQDSSLPPRPEHDLYDLLAAADPRNAHSAYNALVRRLVSFERAMDLVASAAAGGGSRPAPDRS